MTRQKKEEIMLTLLGTKTTHAAADGRSRVRAVSCVIGLTVSLLAIGVQAERAVTRTWVAKSGLQTIFNRHLVRLTVFEAGGATVTSRAVIELRDRRGRVVARKEGVLTSGAPVQLDLKVAETRQLSAVVEVTGDELAAPLVTFEDINPDLGLVIKVDPPCGPGIGPSDPQALCPGWLILTSQQD
jgi:hypothetical protein